MKLMLKKVWRVLYIHIIHTTKHQCSSKCQVPAATNCHWQGKGCFQKVLKKYFLKSDQDQWCSEKVLRGGATRGLTCSATKCERPKCERPQNVRGQHNEIALFHNSRPYACRPAPNFLKFYLWPIITLMSFSDGEVCKNGLNLSKTFYHLQFHIFTSNVHISK